MSSISIGLVPVAILLPFILGIILKGVPLAGIIKLFGILAVFYATFSLAGGVVMYWRFSRSAWSMNSQGVSGVDCSGAKRRIGWGQIDAVVLSDSELDPPDITRLPIRSQASRTEIVARVTGTDLPELFSEIVKHAGAAHPLADWFRRGTLETARSELVALPTPGSRALVIAIWIALLGWLIGFQLWLLPKSQALEGMPECEAANWARLIIVFMLLPFALIALVLGKKAILTFRSRQVPHPNALLFFPARIKRGRTAIAETAGLAGLALFYIGIVLAAWHYLELSYIFFFLPVSVASAGKSGLGVLGFCRDPVIDRYPAKSTVPAHPVPESAWGCDPGLLHRTYCRIRIPRALPLSTFLYILNAYIHRVGRRQGGDESQETRN